MLSVSKAGHNNLQLKEKVASNRARVIHPKLEPICNGALIGKVFVLDARYGEAERGTPPGAADINLAVVNMLSEMLEVAGAKVYRIRKDNRKIAVPKRVAAVNAIQDNGYYLRIDHRDWADTFHRSSWRTIPAIRSQSVMLSQYSTTFFSVIATD